jgi:NAD-dependent SIR2 family protein deacetylase
MSFLVEKQLVNMIYTQNIDGLETKAKIPKEKIVFAHGTLQESHCCGCGKEYDIEIQNAHIKEGKILYCTELNCNHPCKPKVVFYGEQLPSSFGTNFNKIQESDLGIIIGTSLAVKPFNNLPKFMPKSSWRVLINREKVGLQGPGGFQYDEVTSTDLFMNGTSDDIIMKIIEDSGWKEEFHEFIEKKKKE